MSSKPLPIPLSPASHQIRSGAIQILTLQRVKLKIYDVLGREVAVVVDGLQDAGRKVLRFDAGRLGPGIYLYRLEAAGFSDVKRFVRIR